MKTAVVTGGAGFLGSHLTDRLLKEGFRVIGVDNFITGNPANLDHLKGNPNYSFIEQDVTKYLDIPGDVNIVFHFASPASPIDYLELPIQTLKVGSLGTHNALGLAKAKKAAFLIASTSECYGDPLVHPQTEDYWGNVNPVGPRGVYDEAKRYAEALTMAYLTQQGVDTAIVRIFNTYGPRMRPHDGRAIPTFIRQALAGVPVTVTGDGSQTRSVCFVDDLVRGILAMARSGEPGPVNLGNPCELSVRQIADDVIAATGSSSAVELVERPEDDPQVRRPDTTRAAELLGWAPGVTWEEGLERTVAWFADQLRDSA